MKIGLKELSALIAQAINENEPPKVDMTGVPEPKKKLEKSEAEASAEIINPIFKELEGSEESKAKLRQGLINIGLDTGLKSITNAKFVAAAAKDVKTNLDQVKQEKKKAQAEKNRRDLLLSPGATKREKQISPNESMLRDYISLLIEASYEDHAFEKAIDELLEEPEFENVLDFIESKLANDETTFTTLELQALARWRTAQQQKLNVKRIGVASGKNLETIKNELLSYGLTFAPRVPPKHTRGIRSGIHGTNPFAGTGAGGSGFGMDGFTAHGGGPGAIGGGHAWNSHDKRNLSMGAGKKR